MRTRGDWVLVFTGQLLMDRHDLMKSANGMRCICSGRVINYQLFNCSVDRRIKWCAGPGIIRPERVSFSSRRYRIHSVVCLLSAVSVARQCLLSFCLSVCILFSSRQPCQFPPRPQLGAADPSSVRPRLCASRPLHICPSAHPAGGGSPPRQRAVRRPQTPRSHRLSTKSAN